jgi:hypothetical protein
LKIIKLDLSDKDNKKGTLVRIGKSGSLINMIHILMKYLIIGYAVYLGLIFPIIGIIAVLVKIGIDNLTYTMILLLLIDIVVIICCAYLILNRIKIKFK